MLDFDEVGRRIVQHSGCQCGASTHEYIVSPVVGQLLDPEFQFSGGQGAFLAPHECANLGRTILKQAQMLDANERMFEEAGGLAHDVKDAHDRFVKAVNRLKLQALLGWALALIATTVLVVHG